MQLSGKFARLAQAQPALLPGSGRDAGPPLLLRQRRAVFGGSRGQAGPGAQLRGRFGIVRFGPAAPALPVASQVPHPITAAPALDGSIKAFSPAAQVRAREAPVGSQVGRQLDTRLRHPLSG